MSKTEDVLMTGASQGWVEKTSRLRFSFAGIVFYAATFRSAVLDRPVAFRANTSELRPPLELLLRRVRAARIPCLPIETKLPLVALLPIAIRYVPSQYRRFYIEIRGSFATYLRKFSSKSRKNLSRNVRKFAEFSGGIIQWCEFRRPAEMPEFCRLAREVSKRTYQERLLDAGIPATDQFREEITSLAARDGIRGYILFHGERPVAYNLCHAEEETLTYVKTGFDPEFASRDPGNVLLYLMLQKLFEEARFSVFDFGSGEFGYKEYFSTGSIRCADVYYFRRTLGNFVLVCTHCALDSISAALKKALDSVGLKARIKKLIHRKLFRQPRH